MARARLAHRIDVRLRVRAGRPGWCTTLALALVGCLPLPGFAPEDAVDTADAAAEVAVDSYAPTDSGSEVPSDAAITEVEPADGDDGADDGGDVVAGPSPVRELAVESYVVCARREDGSIWCWGRNRAAHFASPASEDVYAPTRLERPRARALASGDRHHCLLTDEDEPRILCWGDNSDGRCGGAPLGVTHLPIEVPLDDVTSVAAGARATCALRLDGTIWCWGMTLDGQPWNGTRVSPVPAAVPGVSGEEGYVELAIGTASACARRGTVGVDCWGAQLLGDGSNEASASPVRVALPEGTVVDRIGSGDGHHCAIASHADGGPSPRTIWCWGLNNAGQVGQPSGDVATPKAISSFYFDTAPTHVEGGWRHTCALLLEGAVRCWGSNERGASGQMASVPDATPRLVPDLTGASLLSVGFPTSCVVTGDGEVRCWGSNVHGQLGAGTTDDGPHPTPVIVPL